MKRAKVTSVYEGGRRSINGEDQNSSSKQARLNAKARKYSKPQPFIFYESTTLKTRSMAKTEAKTTEVGDIEEAGIDVVNFANPQTLMPSVLNLDVHREAIDVDHNGVTNWKLEWLWNWSYEEEWVWSGWGGRHYWEVVSDFGSFGEVLDDEKLYGRTMFGTFGTLTRYQNFKRL